MDVIERLQSHSIKPSVQRIAIMQYLMDHHTHPTVDEIYTALAPSMPTLSKTTVYNTLKLLDEHAAIQTLTIDGRNTCYDGDTTPHAHFFCKVCCKVYDLPCSPELFRLAESGSEGHDVQEVHYYYKGICKHCKERNCY
ncbi:Fur family transcriptional regulator [Mediterranea massiliensis]|uniref:Fur family transcriptional regulator n=1 Tax=Mediterranea massiliensis TaxID=1841865 RepID=UPI00320BAB1E